MANSISPEAIKKMISYYYLVSFCPPEYVGEIKEAGQKMRTRLAEANDCTMEEFSEVVVPEVARRVAAFHTATREPDPEGVDALTQMLKIADNSPKETAAFQGVMHLVAAHPGRAKLGNRLHRQKGCAFCEAPCQYGLFTLMSEPDFKTLQAMLDAENKKIAQERDAVNVLWIYTREQIWKVLEARGGVIRADILGNLSYCLLTLGTAKSRFAMPEKQLKMFQTLNQRTIRNLPSPVISLDG